MVLAMRCAGTLRAMGRSIQSLYQGKVDRESRMGEVQQLARVELPDRSAGRGNQLPSWFVDTVAAASNLLSGYDSGRKKQPVGTQAAFLPVAAAVFTASCITGTPSDRCGSAHSYSTISEAAQAASSSTSRAP